MSEFGNVYREAKESASLMSAQTIAVRLKILRRTVKDAQLEDPKGFMPKTVHERATIIAYTEILIRKGGN